MNCDDIDKALVEGVIASPARQHLDKCKRCRELVATLSLPVAEVSPSPATLRLIERGLAADFRPVRPIAAKPYLLAALIAIFVCVVALGVYRIGAFALAAMSPLQAIVIFGALAISAGLLGYSLVNQMVPGSLHRIPPAVLPLAIIVSLAMAILLLFQFQHERNFWAKSWWCIRAGTPIGALAAVPLWFVLRRGAVLSPSMTGLASGLFAGLVGTTALEIHCPILDASHILISHLGVAALGAMTGLVFGLVAENSIKNRASRNSVIARSE
jgi:hypothetical protein